MPGSSFFEPHIRLTREFDGEYTFHALTLTPNGCWQAGPARDAVPPTVRLLPEVQPVILTMRHDPGPCLQAVKPVRHCLSDLKLGAAQGKTTLTAFVMLGERILGFSSVDVSALGQIGKGEDKHKSPIIDSADWYAWVNRMPGAQQAFYVTGSVTVPNPGYRVSLQPASPQGINPRELILVVEVERLPGVWPQVVATKTVRYEISPYSNDYDGVLVQLPDGRGLQLDIEEVF